MVYVPSMNIGWTLRRLRSMSPAEIAHRVIERGRQAVSRGRHEGWDRYAARPLRAAFPQWPQRLGGATSEQRASIRAAADRYLAGAFSALARDWPRRDPGDLFPAEAWRLDPVTGGLWPGDAYCFDINYRHGGGLGDVKYVWEFNRLQMLPVLAAAALIEDDAQAVGAIDSAVASWYAANPPFIGVGWASGIEVAVRAISLIAVHSLLGVRLGRPTQDRIRQILAASAFWLHRFPSLFSSANNHRVAELAGEALIARALGGSPAAPEAKLARQIGKQILPDGAGAEQSPTYAAFTAELALLCVDAARQAGTPFDTPASDRLLAFAEFVRWLGPLRFGDDDEGRALTLGDETGYAGSVGAAIVGILGGTALPSAGDALRSALFASADHAGASPQGLKPFDAGGLTIWRGTLAGRAVEFTLDHGPLGYLAIAAHGHADAGAITLAIDGRPVLVDPGTYLYGSGGMWRDWFRSTPAHNTLNLRGESQSLMAGPFNWSLKAKARVEETRPEPDWSIRMQHDGYKTRYGVLHERQVERRGNSIAIVDRLIGMDRESEIVFQLAPGLDATSDGATVTIRDGATPLLSIQMPNEHVSVTAGAEDEPSTGWVSPRFGIKLAATRISWRGLVGAGGVTTRLEPLARR